MKTRFLSILAAFALTGAAAAQPTDLTYQGHLKKSGQPASGPHDFRFRLFDAAQGGNQLGDTQCVNNLGVAEGLFTATIDFGQQFASPKQRFLEIQVRKDTGKGCGDATGFVTLTPRQTLTAAPLANHAKSAFALDAADGTPKNAVFVDNDGQVGIGTLAPDFPLHIKNNTFAVLALQDSQPANMQAGYVSLRNDSNVETAWMGFGTAGSPHFSIVNARSGGNIVLWPFTGNVGIGTDSPAAKLEVRGDIRFGTSGQFRTTAGEEDLRIIRGDVFPGDSCDDGISKAGVGFTVSELSCKEFRITFDTPFAGAPAVVASSGWDFNSGSRYVTCSDVSTAGASMRVFVANGNNVRWRFTFMAVGPR